MLKQTLAAPKSRLYSAPTWRERQTLAMGPQTPVKQVLDMASELFDNGDRVTGRKGPSTASSKFVIQQLR